MSKIRKEQLKNLLKICKIKTVNSVTEKILNFIDFTSNIESFIFQTSNLFMSDLPLNVKNILEKTMHGKIHFDFDCFGCSKYFRPLRSAKGTKDVFPRLLKLKLRILAILANQQIFVLCLNVTRTPAASGLLSRVTFPSSEIFRLRRNHTSQLAKPCTFLWLWKVLPGQRFIA